MIATPTPPSPKWRAPTQERSRKRVAALLDAAYGLAIEHGHLDFKVTDVATRAGVPIGSLYQFFPNRAALLAQLFAREMAPVDEALRNGLTRATTTDGVIRGVSVMLKRTLALVAAQPGLAVIWTSPSIDPAIQAADFENSKANARAIATRLRDLGAPQKNDKAIFETALLTCHLWGQFIRLTLLLENDAPKNTVLKQYTKMIEGRLKELAE